MDDRYRHIAQQQRQDKNDPVSASPSEMLRPSGRLSPRQRRSREYRNRQWHAGLPPRVYRSLLANGLTTREAIVQAWEQDRLVPGRYPGIGKQAIAQIHCWLFPCHCQSASPPRRSPRQIAIILEPEAQEALKRLKYRDESPQAAINRLIIESDRDMQILAETLDP